MTVLEFAVGDDLQRVVLRQPDGIAENLLAVANESTLLRLLKAIGLPVPDAARRRIDGSVRCPVSGDRLHRRRARIVEAIAPDSIEQMASQLVQSTARCYRYRARIAACIHTALCISAIAHIPIHRCVPTTSARRCVEAGRAVWYPVALLHGDWPGNLPWNGGRLVEWSIGKR
jgi:hypothetical protein